MCFHTSSSSLYSNNREAIDHSSNSTTAFAFTRIFCKCESHGWAERIIDSLPLLFGSEDLGEVWKLFCESYGIHYQKPNALWFDEANYERNKLFYTIKYLV